jgi:hypothetical protein
MHSTNDLNDGYLGSGKRLRYSVKKYGAENHTIEILEFFDNREKLIQREKEVVTLNEIAKKDCMNIMLGGTGGLINSDHHKKMMKAQRKWLTNKWKDSEYRMKMSKLSSERMKENHKKGKFRYDKFKDKKHTEETKIKMSITSKGMGVGNKNSQYGTCWITNGFENKKIKKTDTLPDGWCLGRKLKQ